MRTFFRSFSYFRNIEEVQIDKVFKQVEIFKSDRNVEKVNFLLGVYKDDLGATTYLKSVENSFKEIVKGYYDFDYRPLGGCPEFNDLNKKFCFGLYKDFPAEINSVNEFSEYLERICSIQTVGGTSALRMAFDLIRLVSDQENVYSYNENWQNYVNIIKNSNFTLCNLPYYDIKNNSITFDLFFTSLRALPANSLVLLQTGCHNPTGYDLSYDQWISVLDLAQEKEFYIIFDNAYQGFASLDIKKDSLVIKNALVRGMEFMVCNSFSKNMGLYSERLGGLHVVSNDSDIRSKILSNLRVLARSDYSVPPCIGASIATKIFQDSSKFKEWTSEVRDLMLNLQNKRESLYQVLYNLLPDRELDNIKNTQGLFLYMPFDSDEISRLKNEFSCYFTSKGRINISAINPKSLSLLEKAVRGLVSV